MEICTLGIAVMRSDINVAQRVAIKAPQSRRRILMMNSFLQCHRHKIITVITNTTNQVFRG